MTAPAINALNTILSQLRVSGAVVLSQAHPIPWAISVPESNALRGALGVDENVTVVPFHIARRGHFDLHPVDGDSVVVNESQLVICANGQGHVMGSGDAPEQRTFAQVLASGSIDRGMGQVGHTDVICGVFLLRNTRHNPLVNALPSLVKIDIQGEQSSSTLQQLNALLNAEISTSRNAQSYMLERILEMLYAEAIRIFSEQHSEHYPSWLAAINDDRVGLALNYIHSNLGKPIHVEELAQQVALSPSRFASCFRDLVGSSPGVYITAQRQALAAELLLETNQSVQEIAFACGYQSIPSFNKAFNQQHGLSPSIWRQENKPAYG